MRKKVIDRLMVLLFMPVYLIYGILFLLSFPGELILDSLGINLGIKNEIKNIFRSDNIRKYYVYAFFRMINVAIFFYFIHTIRHTSLLNISQLKRMFLALLISVATIFLMHQIKRLLFKKMGITPFREVNPKDMDGKKFEHYCAELLRVNGYKNVRITKASGDQGVDIVAELKNEKYAVQCKHYSRPLGNKPVQEVYAGKTYYECDRAMVMTNNRFTKGAYELAESVDVKLWPMIPIMDTGRGLTYFWYVVDIAIMTGVFAVFRNNLDNVSGIILLSIALLYLILFVILCVDFLTARDLAYYKKNLDYLDEAELDRYRDLIEQLASETDEYENIAGTTSEIEDFIYAERKIEDVYDEISYHDEGDILPDSVENKMDRYYQSKHLMEIEFIERVYERNEDDKLLIPASDYERMMDFTDEAKEYLAREIYEYI